jgi:hypothetical protein
MPIFLVIIGRAAKPFNTKYAGNIIKILMLYFLLENGII